MSSTTVTNIMKRLMRYLLSSRSPPERFAPMVARADTALKVMSTIRKEPRPPSLGPRPRMVMVATVEGRRLTVRMCEILGLAMVP